MGLAHEEKNWEGEKLDPTWGKKNDRLEEYISLMQCDGNVN